MVLTSSSEHIFRLHSSIREGGHPDTSTSVHSHIDAAAFWRDAFERSEKTQAALQDKVYELEQQNAEITEKLKSTGNPSLGILPQRKRKKDAVEEAECSVGRARKAAKVTEDIVKVVHLGHISVQCAIDGLEDSLSITHGTNDTPPERRWSLIDVAGSFLCDLYDVHRLAALRYPPVEELTAVLTKTVSDIALLFSATQSASNSEIMSSLNEKATKARVQTRSKSQTRTTLNRCNEEKLFFAGRTLPVLLAGLDKLGKTVEGLKQQGQVVYNFVRLFRELLERINVVSVMQATKRPLSRKKPNKIQAQSEHRTSESPSSPEDAIMELCRLIIRMAACLDTTKAAHNAISEGFLHFLFNQIGSLLKIFVFGNSGNDILDEELQGQPRPTLGSNRELKQGLSSIEPAAPYLIWILERAMILRTRQQGLAVGGDSCIVAIKLIKQTNKNNQLGTSRLQLQHTLLKSLFGEHTKDFENALRQPIYPDLAINDGVRICKEGEVADWYKQEVWRLIGWDILRENIEWKRPIRQ